MMKNIKLAAAAASVMLASGCASVMTSEMQTIEVKTSNQKAVSVTVDGKSVTAPGMVTVLRDGKDKVARVDDNSCDNATPIKKEVTPVFFGNIIIGGLLGSTTDYTTGKMWDYEDTVTVSCSN